MVITKKTKTIIFQGFRGGLTFSSWGLGVQPFPGAPNANFY